jgi:hypothetical protein
MNSNLKSISRSLSSGLKSVEARASSLATDKNVLYIMLVIAVVNVVGYLMMGNFEAVVFFAIVAYLSTFFTKNMVVVFLVSILATNFLMVSKVNYFSRMNSKEGMQNKAADAKDAADAKAVTKPSASASASPSASASASPSSSPSASPSPSPVPKPTKSDSKKTSAEKKKEGMNGKLAPAKFNDESDDDGDASPFPGNNADRNAQMEKVHDTLQNISNGAGVGAGAGAGGMKLQTEEVMKQQKMLMDNIKVMQPFLETAERFLDKFNMKGIDGLLGKMGMGSAATPSPSP